MEFGTLITPTVAPMPHMLVLPPQLMSLADGFDLVQSGLRDLLAKGWYAIFAHMPFLPGHFCPKGMTTRELEPDNPRPTTDGSGPNCKPGGAPALLDTEGRPVYSPNWRARGAAALHGRGDPEGSILSEEEDCTSFSEPQPVGESGLHQRPSRAQEPIELPKGWEARWRTPGNVQLRRATGGCGVARPPSVSSRAIVGNHESTWCSGTF